MREAQGEVVPVGEWLQEFYTAWAQITSDERVLDVLSSGYMLEFARPLAEAFVRPPCKAPHKINVVRRAGEALEAVAEVP